MNFDFLSPQLRQNEDGKTDTSSPETVAAVVEAGLKTLMPQTIGALLEQFSKAEKLPTEDDLAHPGFKLSISRHLAQTPVIDAYAINTARVEAVGNEFDQQFPDFKKNVFDGTILNLYPDLESLPQLIRIGAFGLADALANGWLRNVAASRDKLQRSNLDSDEVLRQRRSDILEYLVNHRHLTGQQDPQYSSVSSEIDQHYKQIATFWFDYTEDREQGRKKDVGGDTDSTLYYNEREALAKLRHAVNNRGTHYDVLGVNQDDFEEETDEDDYSEMLDFAYKSMQFIHPDRAAALKALGLSDIEANKLMQGKAFFLTIRLTLPCTEALSNQFGP